MSSYFDWANSSRDKVWVWDGSRLHIAGRRDLDYDEEYFYALGGLVGHHGSVEARNMWRGLFDAGKRTAVVVRQFKHPPSALMGALDRTFAPDQIVDQDGEDLMKEMVTPSWRHYYTRRSKFLTNPADRASSVAAGLVDSILNGQHPRSVIEQALVHNRFTSRKEQPVKEAEDHDVLTPEEIKSLEKYVSDTLGEKINLTKGRSYRDSVNYESPDIPSRERFWFEKFVASWGVSVQVWVPDDPATEKIGAIFRVGYQHGGLSNGGSNGVSCSIVLNRKTNTWSLLHRG